MCRTGLGPVCDPSQASPIRTITATVAPAATATPMCRISVAAVNAAAAAGQSARPPPTMYRAAQQLCGERYGRPVGELETMFRDERTHGMSVRPVVEDRKVSRWIDDEDGGEPDQEQRRNGEIRHGMTVDRGCDPADTSR